MRLKLFDNIDHIVDYYSQNIRTYERVNMLLINFLNKQIKTKNKNITSIYSRIKTNASVREKLIRNKYYINFKSPNETLDKMPDLIGITLECMFIRDEVDIYKCLLDSFLDIGNTYYISKDNKKVFLNLSMPQPQLQRNGFAIYRIDGYYLYKDERVNFELQIKAMVHSFWNSIEHQVVYKNTKMMINNQFITNMLTSIKDNLDVLDKQLELIYQQISDTRMDKEIGLTAEGLKLLLANSINEVASKQMLNNIGININFKKCSSVLSQYIYINDFLRSENPEIKMVEYFEHLNYLKSVEIDFSQTIEIGDFSHSDLFCDKLGKYWLDLMNEDYEWHIFFMILFYLQKGEPIYTFRIFIETVKSMIFIKDLSLERLNNTIITSIEEEVFLYMVDKKDLSMVHEDNIYILMQAVNRLNNFLLENLDNFDMSNIGSLIKNKLHIYIKILYNK